MAFTCPTVPPTAGCYNDFLGFPSKFNTLFNKESTFGPSTFGPSTFGPSTFGPSTFGPSTVPTPFTGFPTTFERSVPTPFSGFPSTFFGGFPWSNNFGAYPWGYERFPWSNWTPSTWSNNTWTGFPNTWTGFPTTNWTGFPTNNWNNFPTNWTGFPTNSWTGNFGGNNFNNNTLCATTFRPSSEAEYFTLKNPIRFFEDGTRGLWLCFDLRGYKPEEVCVTINKAERCIIVEACHDVKESGVSRKFYRKFVLPEYLAKIDITKIEFKSFFGPDGLFYVEGTFPRLTAEEYSAWPAYPYVLSCWTNPQWCFTNNAWTNNSTWAARPWTYNNWTNWINWTQNTWNAKPITCKLI